jgi:amino acid adenylation domain-containing protein
MGDKQTLIADEPDVVVADEPEVYFLPASFVQQRLWFLEQWESGTAVYNTPVVYRLTGELQCEALERTINEIVARHEVLRTTFVNQDDVVSQRIVSSLTIPLTIVAVQSECELQQQVRDEVRVPFDLATGPLLRAALFRLSDTDHVLALTSHHVIFDGWSEGVLLRELQAIYPAFCQGLPSPLPELPIQYGDYAVWQRDHLAGDDLGLQVEYWKRQLADLPVLDLPLDRPRPKMQTFNGATRPLAMPLRVASALKAIALQEKATLFVTLAAALQAVLHRYSGQDSVPVGIMTSGRVRSEVEDLLGCFVNTLVLRGDINGDPTFRQLLTRVREAALGAYANPDVPFEKLVDELHVQRDLSRTPLFQVLINQAPPRLDDLLGDLTLKRFPVDVGVAKFDLSFYLSEVPDGLTGLLEYNSDLFDRGTIDRLAGHYSTLLEAVAGNPDVPLSSLSLLSADERRQMLVDWNATTRDYPEKTVVQLFEEQASRRPDAVAVAADTQTLTYGVLLARSNALAIELAARGLKAGGLVGVCVERSPNMMVALLAILKVGATYVPLDPAFPADRLSFMLQDSGAAMLVTETALADVIRDHDAKTVCIDELDLDAETRATETRASGQMDDLAYVLYTSGSTGKPKGVEISHRALTNFLWSMRTEPGCTEQDSVLAVTTLSFDIAGLELWLPLISGGRIELASRGVAADGRRLRERIERTRPSMMQATPATYRMLIDAGWQGDRELAALIGGEPLPAELIAPLLQRTKALWNMYGPTETTIWSSIQRITTPDEDITIGRPIANTEFYVLDQSLQPVPIGVPGELFIGGDGLARGYRGRPELTSEKFIPHPLDGRIGERLYRTGDQAKYRHSGQVVHLGRLDNQVKIRGFRIELGEIETALTRHPHVAQAVVAVRKDPSGDANLVAYVIAASEASVSSADLRQHLRTTLPDYMLPQYVVTLSEFPLTPNGKVDRKRLPDPERRSDDAGRTYEAPRTPTEETICEIWAELLQVSQVGIHDDFFELGGHSLRAVALVSRLVDCFNVDVPLQVLFEAATPARLADKICDLKGLPKPAQHPGDDQDLVTATERRVAAIWERTLGRTRVGRRESFVELQGAHDLTDRMLTEVRLAFGVFAEGIPLSAFLDEPTVEGLARLLDGNVATPSSLVVCLQPRGSSAPLFLIHAGGGYVFFYRALAARLGPDRPVYAIRAETSADGLGHPFENTHSVKELAARYISQMKTIQPRGPYLLGGACFGGVVAFEMAQQLCEQGEATERPVLLFEAFLNNNAAAPRSTQTAYWRARAVDRFRRLSQMGVARAIPYILGRLQSVSKAILKESTGAVRSRLGRFGNAFRAQAATEEVKEAPRDAAAAEPLQPEFAQRYLHKAIELIGRYRPTSYPGSIVIFKTERGDDPEPPWTGLALSGSKRHVMPGTHLEMLEEPDVAETASLVRRHLG